MNRSDAKKLIDMFVDCQSKMEEVLPEIEKLENEVERVKLRKVVADTIALIYTDAIMKMAHQFPDLNPFTDK